jgi:membrane fusion protein (multidrug efflux system)
METARNPRSPEASASVRPAVDGPTSSASANVAVVDTSAAPPRSRRRPFLILGVVAVAVLGGIAVYHFATAGREGTDDAQVSADMVPVGTRVAGAVARVHITENQQVKKGELLVEIDRADFAARARQAEAELATAQAQATAADAQVQIVEATSKGGFASARAALVGSTVGVSGADAQLAVARATLARAESDARKAGIDLARAQELRRANAAPQERLDGAQAAYDASRAALAQAQAQISFAQEARRTAESRVGEARGRVSQSAPIAPQIAAARAGADLAKARVQSAEAALALAKLQLDYTHVLAPADGVASKLMVHDGQLVGVGQPLVELVPSATYVLANFKETQIGRMRPGQHAQIELDAFPGRKLDGRIESLAGGTGASFSLLPADNATGNFVKVVQRVPVRIAWVNPPSDIPLRAGLSADVTVSVDK